DPARGRRLRPVEKPRALCGAGSADVRAWPRRRLRLRFRRHPLADPLRRDPRLPAVRVVPDRVRRGGAVDGLLRMGKLESLALHPGQAGFSPAADGVAMLLVVLVALEAF